MKQRHVIQYFQARYENRLSEGERLSVEQHLEDCDTCRRYYEKMTAMLEGIDQVRLPHLEPDPFLPARIRALAGKSDPLGSRAGQTGTGGESRLRTRPVFGRLAASVMSVAVVSAGLLGVLAGNELSSRTEAAEQSENDAITNAYYETFSPSGIDGNWEYVIENENGDNS